MDKRPKIGDIVSGMKCRIDRVLRGLAVAFWLGLAQGSAWSQPWISEILLNPPGPGANEVFQYVEIRGIPNLLLTNGTFLVGIEGDAGGNPGTIQDVFDLSGRRLGGNGFLVLLQKSNTYSVAHGAMALTQAGADDGFGSGSGSSIGHKGENSAVEMEGPSVTFFLIQTTNKPALGDDLDANNDGIPDAPWFASWTIFDSVGVLDNTGTGDIAYGAINFRRNSAATATGTVVPLPFTPDYLGRSGNTTGSTAGEWVAANNLAGTAPNFILNDGTHTFPAAFASNLLNHVGGPNFGAPALSGVMVTPNQGNLSVIEGGQTGSYSIALNTPPAGRVSLAVTADDLVEISQDGGGSFASSVTLVLSNASPRMLTIRAKEDRLVRGLSHAVIRHAITATEDAVNYPATAVIPEVAVHITDNDFALLNELKVNPPGADAPCEYVELFGTPGGVLTNVYFVAIEGNGNDNPGKVNLALNLSGAGFGSNGLLFVAAPNHPYSLPPASGFLAVPRLGETNAALKNGAATFLLVATAEWVEEGADWDAGDNGKLEGLPADALVLDAVALLDGNTNSIAYSAAVLKLPQGVPDAASRYATNLAPGLSNAWFFGHLAGTNSTTLEYDALAASPNFPYGTLLSPGAENTIGPTLSQVRPICGTIGDPTNPQVTFQTAHAAANANALIVWAESSNPDVVTNLTPSLIAPGQWQLAITPHGVGYATITLHADDGQRHAQVSFPYAASAMGRPGGIFHSGAADASTAIPLDADWMLVGDDENQVIRLYSRHFSGPPVWQTNMTPFLGLTDIEAGLPREVDIEASTRVGNRIFWLGAHSHANIAEGRTNRSRLFATDLVGTGTNISLVYAGRYDYLKLDLVNWDAGNGHGKGANYYGFYASTAEGVNPKSPEGFNIEGLTMAPGSATTAYVGLRAPIVPATNRCYALVVPVLNFPSLAGTNLPPGSAVFGPPIELDLFGRGIRSLKGDSNGFLIVAGTPLNFAGPYPDDFKLYTWTGNPSDPPRELEADLGGLTPEGIVELPPPPWTPQSAVQLLSDNGMRDWYGDGTPAKFLPIREFRKFRSDVVALGSFVTPWPWVQSLQITNQSVIVNWRATAGVTYRVQYTDDLRAPTWQTLPGEVTASGPWAFKTDTGFSGRRFYRVVMP